MLNRLVLISGVTPGDEVLLAELNARKDKARRRHARGRVDELQAQIDELDADYDSALHAAVLI